MFPTTLTEVVGKTNSQVWLVWSAWNLFCIALNYIGSESAWEIEVDSEGCVSNADK